MTRRLVVLMVGLVAGTLLIAGIGTLALAHVRARADTESDLRTQAVPNSNEWLELTDRVNSIQANLDGNRSPWNYALSSAVNYWSPISSRQG